MCTSRLYGTILRVGRTSRNWPRSSELRVLVSNYCVCIKKVETSPPPPPAWGAVTFPSRFVLPAATYVRYNILYYTYTFTCVCIAYTLYSLKSTGCFPGRIKLTKRKRQRQHVRRIQVYTSIRVLWTTRRLFLLLLLLLLITRKINHRFF